MSFKNILVSSSIVAGLGAGGYAAYIYSLTKYLEVLPPEEAQPYFAAMQQKMEPSDRIFAFAYRAPTVLPTRHDAVEVFGKKAVAKQASYIAADGAKEVGTVFADHKGNSALGSLFALQALERATPLLPLRAAALFWDNFQVSRQWHVLMHNRKSTMAVARERVVHAASDKEATALTQSYCEEVAALTLEKHVVAQPALRMAVVQETCGTTAAAALEMTNKENPRPREAALLVLCTAPIPDGVEDGSLSYKVLSFVGDCCSRWLAVNATSALSQL